jgi:hypothetical protein
MHCDFVFVIYINACWFLQVSCCQKKVQIVSDSDEGRNFLILCYACGFKLMLLIVWSCMARCFAWEKFCFARKVFAF